MSVAFVTNTISEIYVAPEDGQVKPTDGSAITGVLSAEAFITPEHDGHIHIVCDLNKIFAGVTLEVPITDTDNQPAQGTAGTYSNSSSWLTSSPLGMFNVCALYQSTGDGSFGTPWVGGPDTCTNCMTAVLTELFRSVYVMDAFGQFIDPAKVELLLESVTHQELWTDQQYQDLASKLINNSSKFQFDAVNSVYKTNFSNGDSCRLYTNIVDQSRPKIDEPDTNKFQLLWTFEHLDGAAYPL